MEACIRIIDRWILRRLVDELIVEALDDGQRYGNTPSHPQATSLAREVIVNTLDRLAAERELCREYGPEAWRTILPGWVRKVGI